MPQIIPTQVTTSISIPLTDPLSPNFFQQSKDMSGMDDMAYSFELKNNSLHWLINSENPCLLKLYQNVH